ncbi:S-adenosyl-L-methionine-dependent methyltransferase [Coprinopsis sp. MPI-PUGE-AT-0042]|nr:S-adenosyl-L-methionine-dependent methyltransferase [Coprinopsis sp. MPI-PUGE-AT-0042]
MATTTSHFKDPELQVKVQKVINSNLDDPAQWDILWKESLTPWDAGIIQPSLIELINESGIEWPRRGKALVPGCGTGYDVFYLASALDGIQAYGMDVSETAIETATRYRDTNSLSKPTYKNAQFLHKDFFTVELPEEERFELVMDHTFFCAIPPSRRGEWGRRMAEIIKPGGYLITNCYPMLPQMETGPPFYLRPDHYDEPLQGTFEKIYDKVPTRSSESHEGKERMFVWKRL